MPLKPLPYPEVKRKLIVAGFSEISQKGSHVKFVKSTPEMIRTAIVPQHREIAIGTLHSILGAGINLTFIIFWQPQVATWGYSHSTPSGLCLLSIKELGKAIFSRWASTELMKETTIENPLPSESERQVVLFDDSQPLPIRLSDKKFNQLREFI